MFLRSLDRLAPFVLLTLLSAIGQPAAAQMMPEMHLYVVSFECGFQVSDAGTEDYEPMVKVANYATKVDIFNYGMNAANVVAEAFSTGNNRWASSVAGQALPVNLLQGHQATVIDCVNIAQAITGGAIPPGKPFYTGMLRIMSPEPLFVWATKTTQICSGTARTTAGALVTPHVAYDILTGAFYNTVTQTPEVVDLSIFGCPSAGLGERGFPGPAGEVPPNSRTPHDGAIFGPIVVPPVPDLPAGGFSFSNVSVSHSLDFERVEGVVVID